LILVSIAGFAVLFLRANVWHSFTKLPLTQFRLYKGLVRMMLIHST